MSVKKSNIVIGVLVGLVIVLSSVAGYFYWENSRLKEENNQISTQTKNNGSTTEGTSNQDAVKTTIELNGVLNLVYGDPLNQNGTPRYSYSVTNDQGKTTELKFTDDTKYIGGKKASDFNRNKVKITGKLITSSNSTEVLTIELE